MAKFNFNLREAQSNIDNPTKTPIYLVVRWDNKKLVYPTGETINPIYWQNDNKKPDYQRATQTKKFKTHAELNSRLKQIDADADNGFRQFVNDYKRQPTVIELRKVLDLVFKKEEVKEVEKKIDLFGSIDLFISDSEIRTGKRTGKLLRPVTIRIYKRSRDVFKEYCQTLNRKIDFQDIDMNFYFGYKSFLTKKKGFSTNTIGKHIRALKIFLNAATERNLNTNFEYKKSGFEIPNEEVESIYLNEDELNQMFDLDLSKNPRLERVRDLFLVGCWTGLRFSDFSNITPENIKGDFIEIKTQKTKKTVVIPIHSTVKRIMERYIGKFDNSLPPSISNAKMNLYIKEVAKMVECLKSNIENTYTKGGVELISNTPKHDLVTTHTARRSFATNLYNDKFPTYSIMQITGHKTEKAFLTYIKVSSDEHAKVLQLHWQRKEFNLRAV